MSRKKNTFQRKKYSVLGLRIKVLLSSLHLNQSDLAKLLSVSPGYISDLMGPPKKGRPQRGGLKFWASIERELPQWKKYLEGNEKEPPPYIEPVPYEQTHEHMGIPSGQEGHDADWAEAGRSDIERHRVVEVIEPDYLRMVRDILKSTSTGLAGAMKQMIVQCHKKIELEEDQAEKLRRMDIEIRKLKQRLKRAENFECGSAEGAECAGLKKG